jgi:hypothetical protein
MVTESHRHDAGRPPSPASAAGAGSVIGCMHGGGTVRTGSGDVCAVITAGRSGPPGGSAPTIGGACHLRKRRVRRNLRNSRWAAANPSYRSRTTVRAMTMPAAPARPWTRRMPMSTAGCGATAHTAPSATYTARPVRRARRRPKASLSEPALPYASALPSRWQARRRQHAFHCSSRRAPGRVVADAVGGRLGQQVADPDEGVSRMIEGAPVLVEVRAGTGRSGVVRVMRVRGED